MTRLALPLIVMLLAACGAATVTPSPTGNDTPTPSAPQTSPPSVPATATLTEPPITPQPPTQAPATLTPATPTVAPSDTPEPEPAVFVLQSPAFRNGEPIPSRYTCDGADDQLPVSWNGVPDGTVELALIQHDPDAGGFVHWVVVGIPGDVSSIDGALPDGARHGTNGFGNARYDGPCPPSGNHTYVTTLFALSEPLELGEAPTARQVRQAAEPVTIARAQLNGTYERQP